jgi:hypothetical protein
LVLLMIGLLLTLMFGPQFVQARVVRAVGGDLNGEGDPLDSNDYTGGGGGDTDNDIHEFDSGLIDGVGHKLIRSLLIRRGALLMPFFHGSQLHLRIIDSPVLLPTAVEYEK